ncbi:MAG: universal stress protein [Salinimicrobium sp.]
MKNILVAINHEKNAPVLIAKAEEIALAFNSTIWIIHVNEPDPDSFIGLEAGPQYVQDKRVAKRKKEANLVRQLEADLQKKNLDARGVILEGPTEKMIKKEVKQLHIDLLIAGHHKRNFFYQLFTGKMEQDLIEDLHVPVLLVPVPKK